MAILGFYQYSSSGLEVSRIDLKPGVVNRGTILLDPQMNPLRALVSTGFINNSTSMHVTHYDYRVTVTDQNGVVLLEEANSHFESRKETPSLNQRRMIKRINHVLDSWEVSRPDTYLWTVEIKKRKASIESAALTVRQNVMTSFPASVKLGAVLMIVCFGLLIITGKARKTR
ncbi:hypothetical protein [Candidatus Pelagadaptatus aseana]|uniref:hypothetical protein n=1 Tax=Candidatus Pelagadaptatus aseana TaxID=3120508 RepID=UPI003C6EBD5A